MESLRANDALRRRVSARDLDGFAAQPSLADRARALVQTGATNEAEVARVLGSDWR